MYVQQYLNPEKIINTQQLYYQFFFNTLNDYCIFSEMSQKNKILSLTADFFSINFTLLFQQSLIQQLLLLTKKISKTILKTIPIKFQQSNKVTKIIDIPGTRRLRMFHILKYFLVSKKLLRNFWQQPSLNQVQPNFKENLVKNK
eukprot:TRINITY_DN7889_c1_g1_i9.p8 TRINITY_DN7889_c1_g1~~TRINITY_DN7889_c1_g1_i9.p8  ORF type:complete len:144 (+),score=4.89 TRINITY_DN7889_c1_g1_i9:1642-2073(+)